MLNEQIKYKEVRLIHGTTDAVYHIKTALNLAESEGMDLVLVSDKYTPPVCKILDYSKMLYEKEKNSKQIKQPELKEIKMKYGIAEHDIMIKMNNARRILKDGDKVKISMIFRGREITYIKSGEEILRKCADILKDVTGQRGQLKTENNQVFIILSPN